MGMPRKYVKKNKPIKNWAKYREWFYKRPRWAMVRNKKLEENPFCEVCEVAVATQVHHIVPLKEDRSLAFVLSNLQSVCDPCHATHNIVAHERSRGILLCPVCGMRMRSDGYCRRCEEDG